MTYRNTTNTARLFTDAAEQLVALADRLEGGEAVEAVDIYDVGHDVLGACLCCAWPGEPHDIAEAWGCPHDAADPSKGATFLGTWHASELPAVDEVAAALHDLAASAEPPSDGARQLSGPLLRLYAMRLGERRRAPILCRCGDLLMAGVVCKSDPTPPRCDRCGHELSHGTCPQCRRDAWLEATTPTQAGALELSLGSVSKGGAL